jgi:uncharacterized membrane protein
VVPNDRKVRIEVGYGLEGSITDALSSRIIRSVIGPAFRSGDYGGGVDRALEALMTAASGKAPDLPQDARDNQNQQHGAPPINIVFLLFLFLPFILPFIFGGRRGRRGLGGFFIGGGAWGASSGGGGGWGGGGGVGGGGGGAAASRAAAAVSGAAVRRVPGEASDADGDAVKTVSEADAQRIEGAIAALEARSRAEFVVAVVPASARYSRGRAAVAVAWAVGAALLYFRFLPWGGEMAGLALQVPVAAAVWALFGWAPLHRLLISPAQADKAVRGNAFRLFAERGIHRTRDATGILLLISELEHRAVLLGDRGVHDVVGDAGWAAHVQHLVGRIREGKTAEGVIEVIERLAAVLERDAPVLPDDTDELPNRIVRE